jgi:hypothetical protein
VPCLRVRELRSTLERLGWDWMGELCKRGLAGRETGVRLLTTEHTRKPHASSQAC